MKKISKAGLLILTLVIPALIFVFLQFFARNHYDLPYFNPQRDARGNVMFKGGDTIFVKVNARCPGIQERQFRNKFTVVNTLTQHCDSSCELVMAQLQRIFALRSQIPQLQIATLSSSSDVTETGTAEEMGTAGWDVIKVSENEADQCVSLDQLSGEPAKQSNFSERLMLIDREGYIRGYYKGSDPAEADRLMAEIKILSYGNETAKRN